jgi:hypothetical protein
MTGPKQTPTQTYQQININVLEHVSFLQKKNLLVWLYISAESLSLHQQTEELACWLAEAAVEDSSQFTVTCMSSVQN